MRNAGPQSPAIGQLLVHVDQTIGDRIRRCELEISHRRREHEAGGSDVQPEYPLHVRTGDPRSAGRYPCILYIAVAAKDDFRRCSGRCVARCRVYGAGLHRAAGAGR